mmetsp:Transcript_95124/g.254213  ORF Transcript_95124/g.254213 Transcript_95124/m.254213 type:complete len:208 (+) Transcript_95124:212-835(+)
MGSSTNCPPRPRGPNRLPFKDLGESAPVLVIVTVCSVLLRLSITNGGVTTRWELDVTCLNWARGLGEAGWLVIRSRCWWTVLARGASTASGRTVGTVDARVSFTSPTLCNKLCARMDARLPPVFPTSRRHSSSRLSPKPCPCTPSRHCGGFFSASPLHMFVPSCHRPLASNLPPTPGNWPSIANTLFLMVAALLTRSSTLGRASGTA